MDKFQLDLLEPGDCLLYTGHGFYDLVIEMKTWHPICHVEVYDGDGKTWASRNGIGVSRYLFEPDGLYAVLRPTWEQSLSSARAWAAKLAAKGTPYGWKDLFQFMGLSIQSDGLICSQFAALWYLADGKDIFGQEPPAKIAPFQFATTDDLRVVWKSKKAEKWME